MDVCLQWAVSGYVVKTWCGVPTQTTLGDLVSDELDNLPGEIRIMQTQTTKHIICSIHLMLLWYEATTQKLMDICKVS